MIESGVDLRSTPVDLQVRTIMHVRGVESELPRERRSSPRGCRDLSFHEFA